MEPQLLILLIILGVTVFLIVTELIRIDVVALVAMLALTWTGIVTPEQARAGFASNAVLAIVGVMIMGRGLFRSGLAEQGARLIVEVAGTGWRHIMVLVSSAVGVMSAFVQNVGAAAIFLPVMREISNRQKIPMSRLLMPMGFAALLGGCLTMIGTSSLIVLNDLLTAYGRAPIGLFEVAPIGLMLLLAGIGYFLVGGERLLPVSVDEVDLSDLDSKLLRVWGITDSIYTVRITAGSKLVGQSEEEAQIGAKYHLNLLEVYDGKRPTYEIGDRLSFQRGNVLVLQGREEDVRHFVAEEGLDLIEEGSKTYQNPDEGFIEVVIPARSRFVGQTIREMQMRERYNAQVVLYFSGSEVVENDIADRAIQAGDTLVLEGKWKHLQFFKDSEDFIVVTPFRYEPVHPEKGAVALLCFGGAIAMVLGLDIPISVGFLTGAVGMILGGVISIEEAYRAVDWKVIFLIAGLLPVGLAMSSTGASALAAGWLMNIIQGVHPFLVLLALGVLSTSFSLLMTNVAATVLMVPLVLELAGIPGLTAPMLALQVGLCANNSFLLPTHAVNALLMTSGGYQIRDYLRAGGGLSLIFLLVSTTLLYLLF